MTRPFSPRQPASRPVAGGYVPLAVATLVVFLPLLWMVLSSFKLPGRNRHHGPARSCRRAWTRRTTTDGHDHGAVRAVLPQQHHRHRGGRQPSRCCWPSSPPTLWCSCASPSRTLIFILILVALMVPPQVSILPNYILIAGMGGKNTLWGIILPGLGTAFGTFLLRQHFLTLPGLHPGVGRDRRRRSLAPPVADRGAGVRSVHRHRGPGDRGQRMERIHLAADHHGHARRP